MSPASSHRTVALIGCGGFIGSHLVERLLAARDTRVLGLDKESGKLAGVLGHPRFEFTQGDVYDTQLLSGIVERADVVISLAALCNPSLYNTIPVDVIELNFTHPVALARLCCEHRRWLVHFSTSEVYGKTVEGVLGESIDSAPRHLTVLDELNTPMVLGPVRAQRWSYACAKQLAERMIYALGFQCGLEYTIVRPFNFVGPRMDYIPGVDGDGVPRVLACFMDALMRDKPLCLVDGGTARRTFTDIDDAVDAVMAVLGSREKCRGKIFNVGNPANEVSIAELATMMIREYEQLRPDTRGTHRAVSVTGREFYGEGYEDSDRRVPDISQIVASTGWRPRLDLASALRRSIRAYLDTYETRIAVRAAS